ncbi:MAG: acyltransferase family protein [Lachnospiraceae bacterium]
MKILFKSSISSFFTMIIIVALAVALTGNSSSEEASALGHTVVDSKAANTYIQPANMTIALPAASARFFSDTKNSYVSEYLEQMGMTFAAGIEDKEVDIFVDSVPAEMYDSDFFAEEYLACIRSRDESCEITDFQQKDTITIGGMEFWNAYYVKEDLRYHDWYPVSAYVGMIDQVCVEILLVGYSEEQISAADVAVLAEEPLWDIISSVSYGDCTSVSGTEDNGFLSSLLKYSFSVWIFLIPLFYLLFDHVTLAKNYGEWHEDVLGREHSKELLGFFAVFIVLHHLVQQVGVSNAGVIGFLENFGVCFVGMFFFFSGYGLLQSYHKKPDYLKGFLRNRLPSILIPFYVCTAVYVLNSIFLEQEPFTIRTILQLLGILLINDQAWYIVEIALLYILFWVIFSLVKKENHAMLIMGIGTLFLTGGSLMLGHGESWFQGEWWYNATLLFWVGMLFAKYQTTLLSFLRKHYIRILAASVVLFFVFYRCTLYMLQYHGYWTEYAEISYAQSIADKWMTLAVQLPMVFFFVITILVLGQKIKCHNAVLGFLGTISLELYLIHNFFLKKFSFISGTGMYFLLVLFCSILAAAILHRLDTILLCRLMRRALPERTRILPVFRQLCEALKKAVNGSLLRLKKHPKAVIVEKGKQVVCIVLSFLSVFPIYLTAINATKDRRILGVSIVPGKNFLNNLDAINSMYEGAGGSLYQGIANSCVIAITSALCATYFGAMTAYAFERYSFKGKKYLWGCIIACMMIPQSVCFTGLYQLIVKAGMLNRHLPIILMAAATPSAVYFIRMYLKGVNFGEIVEAARIDGAKELGIFNRIIIPMIRPVLALQLTFSFVAAWNNGYVHTLLLYDWDKKTIASYVRILTGNASSGLPPEAYALMFASTLVPLIVYILCSKSIISSITLGGIKE